MAEKVKLDKISSQSFEHPADKAALEALQKTIGFDRLMRAIAKHGADKIWNIINESSNLRLSQQQVGSIYAIYREVASTLDIEPPPLYLQHDVRVNAYTSGVEAPFIVVTSGLVEGFTDDEIANVLGHEMGHILAGHVLYGMVARSLGLILLLLGGFPKPLDKFIELALLSALMSWQRCAELTADRCGLLAIQDPEVALTTEMKLAAGTGSRIVAELSLDAFMEQVRDFEAEETGTLESVLRAILENERSHPWPVVRAHELDRWVHTGGYQKILDGDYQRRASSVIAAGDRRPGEEEDPTEALAAQAEVVISLALARSYGVHVAPRVPEQPLHLALGAYAETLEASERVVALYDRTVSGHGDRGVLLTDRRVFSSSRPRKGVPYRDVTRLKRIGGGILSSPGLEVEGLELRFHTRAVRDAFAEAIAQAAGAFRGGEPPPVE
jgi:Zn-dependent protease with chaperone function